MRFWDSSAIVPLVVEEAATARMQTVYRGDPVIFAWWGTTVECTSALSRLERDGELDAAAGAAIERLRALQRRWREVQPLETLRDMAPRLLRVHPLRAADSFQLAAAILASENRPVSLDFVCLDARLSLDLYRAAISPRRVHRLPRRMRERAMFPCAD
jgi:predicted nucleic acid-binding protein